MPDPHRISPRSIGFRLLNELEGLLTGIHADGVINEQETLRVRRWLKENEPYAWIHPFSELQTHLEKVLADGVITSEECEDLLFVARKATSFNPYFDAMRHGLQVLMGMLAGVSADGILRDLEVRTLSDWSEEWRHLEGLWPFDECCAIVTGILVRRAVGDGAEALFDLSRQFPVAGELETQRGEMPPLLVKGLCAVNPSTTFTDSRFVFTGESTRAKRAFMEALVVERGGKPWPRVSAEMNYLIVCDEGSPFWAFSCYGRKVEQTYRLRKKGHRAVVAHANDFWDAIASSSTAV
jgi:hypothetical protein